MIALPRRRLWLAIVLLSVVGAGGIEWWRKQIDAPARSIEGLARIVDGDSLEIGGRAIRLIGFDAPEWDQDCRDGTPCGQLSRAALVLLVGGGIVRCQAESIDRYGRMLASCSVAAQDLGRQMVAQGWAVIDQRFPSIYHSELRRAQRLKLGLYAHGGILAPKAHRQESQERGLLFNLRELFSKLQKIN